MRAPGPLPEPPPVRARPDAARPPRTGPVSWAPPRAARLLAAGALFLALGSATGCCFSKRLFGITRYDVCIEADRDAHEYSPTEVILVWPDPEKVASLKDLTWSDIRAQWSRSELKAEDFEIADFGSIEPGLHRHYSTVKELPLHRHCSAERVLLFTSMDRERGGAAYPLTWRGREFAGYIQVRIRQSEVELNYVDEETHPLDKHYQDE